MTDFELKIAWINCRKWKAFLSKNPRRSKIIYDNGTNPPDCYAYIINRGRSGYKFLKIRNTEII